MQELINKIIEWGNERGILSHSNPIKQILKSGSELGEIMDAYAKEDIDALKLEIGDFIVTLILFCELTGNKYRHGEHNDIGLDDEDKINTLATINFFFSTLFTDAVAVNKFYLYEYTINKLSESIRMFCDLLKTTDKECLSLAYNKISQRKTTMVNGVAVK